MPIYARTSGGVYKAVSKILTADGSEIGKVVDSTGRIIYEASRLITVTGVPPISFTKSIGKPLVSWNLLGNGEQTGTPSPDNIIMPTFCGVRTGNLFDKTQPATITNKYLLSNGEESSNAAGWAVSAYIAVNGEYVTLRSVGGNLPSICAYDSNMQFVRGKNYAGKGVTTLSVSGCSYVRFSYVPSVQGNNAMLNAGSTALPYEPYGYKIPFTCAGQTVPVYLGQTQTVRRVKKLVLTGDELWQKSSAYKGSFYTQLIKNWLSLSYTAYCTHAAHVPTLSLYEKGKMVFNGGLTGNCNLWFNQFDENTTVSDFKSYLAAQYAAGTPVTVWYVLAEPETAIVNEPLAKIGDYADELHSTDAAVTIPTAKGNNTLTVDTDLQPSSMTIVYKGR